MTITQLMENSLRATAEILRALAEKERQAWVASDFMFGDNGHKLKRHAENILISLGVMPKRIKVYQALARTFAAWQHCQNHESSNRFATQHEQTINRIIHETFLLDNKASLDFVNSENEKLLIKFEDCGTDYVLTVTPSLQSGFDGKLNAEDTQENDHVYDAFGRWLNSEINPKDFDL
jgi:hypothetical protein